MSDNKHIDISPEAPSLDVLQRYLKGELPEEERKGIEKSLAEDPLLSDALEGLGLIEDQQQMAGAIRRIKSASRERLSARINRREKTKKRQSRVSPQNYTMFFGASAAAIVLLLISVYLIRTALPGSADAAREQITMSQAPASEAEVPANTRVETERSSPQAGLALVDTTDKTSDEAVESDVRQDNLLADNRDRTPKATKGPAQGNGNKVQMTKTPAAPVQTTAPAATPPPVAAAEVSEKPAKELPKTQGKETEDSTADDLQAEELAANESTSDTLTYEDLVSIPLDDTITSEGYAYADDEVAQSRKQKAQALGKKRRKEKDARQAEAVPAPSPKTIPTKPDSDIIQGKIAKGAVMADLLAEAIRLHNQQQYKRSQSNLDEVLLSEPDNLVAHFYSGSNSLSLHDAKSAIQSFKLVVANPQSTLYEEAEWQLVQAYRKRGKKQNARKLLQTIIEAKGKYASEAETLLKQLN